MCYTQWPGSQDRKLALRAATKGHTFYGLSRFCFYLSHLQRLRMASGSRLRAISYNDFQAGEG